MQLVHHPVDGDPRVLATRVETADGFLSRTRGLMFRRSVPEDYALVFHFGRPATRGLHMAFVPFDVDAIWLIDGAVTWVERLPAWRGTGRARADTVLELPAGAADDVGEGDEVRVTYE